jgi:hypothetical protein
MPPSVSSNGRLDDVLRIKECNDQSMSQWAFWRRMVDGGKSKRVLRARNKYLEQCRVGRAAVRQQTEVEQWVSV